MEFVRILMGAISSVTLESGLGLGKLVRAGLETGEAPLNLCIDRPLGSPPISAAGLAYGDALGDPALCLLECPLAWPLGGP